MPTPITAKLKFLTHKGDKKSENLIYAAIHSFMHPWLMAAKLNKHRDRKCVCVNHSTTDNYSRISCATKIMIDDSCCWVKNAFVSLKITSAHRRQQIQDLPKRSILYLVLRGSCVVNKYVL